MCKIVTKALTLFLTGFEKHLYKIL